MSKYIAQRLETFNTKEGNIIIFTDFILKFYRRLLFVMLYVCLTINLCRIWGSNNIHDSTVIAHKELNDSCLWQMYDMFALNVFQLQFNGSLTEIDGIGIANMTYEKRQNGQMADSWIWQKTLIVIFLISMRFQNS